MVGPNLDHDHDHDPNPNPHPNPHPGLHSCGHCVGCGRGSARLGCSQATSAATGAMEAQGTALTAHPTRRPCRLHCNAPIGPGPHPQRPGFTAQVALLLFTSHLSRQLKKGSEGFRALLSLAYLTLRIAFGAVWQAALRIIGQVAAKGRGDGGAVVATD